MMLPMHWGKSHPIFPRDKRAKTLEKAGKMVGFCKNKKSGKIIKKSVDKMAQKWYHMQAVAMNGLCREVSNLYLVN